VPIVAQESSTFLDIQLSGGEWFALVVVAATALLAIGAGVVLARDVLRADVGTRRMVDISAAIEEGARAYLRRQYRTIAAFVVVLTVFVFATTTDPFGDNLAVAVGRAAAFVAGAALSGITGYLGMTFAVQGNVRTAAAAHRGLAPALRVAFRTGGIAGMFTIGLGLLGATVIFMLYQQRAAQVLIGFGFGGSLLALFMRVGGGIFTKAADVGADLVGKVEKEIPEDDPRNPATIADNVGDNVGDCAGMAADLFESYEVTLIAAMILGESAARALGIPGVVGVVFPLLVRAVGVVASIVGVYAVRVRPGDERSGLRPIQNGFLVSAALVAAGTAVLVATYGRGEWTFLWAVVAGLVLAAVISFLTEHYTSTERSPVLEIADSTETGAATTILAGFAVGLESTVWAILAIGAAIGSALVFAGGDIQVALYLVSLTGMGMLATTGVVVSMDSYGPVADNAAGIAEMSGEFEGEPARVMHSLDAVGNTTKAITKGFAIASAVVAAVSLFASFVETVATERGLGRGPEIFDLVPINIAQPKTFTGLLVGGSIAFLFSALAIRAVGRAAGLVVGEVRAQFRDHPGIMSGSERPNYARVVDICTAASLRELATPALLAVLSPVVVGFALGDLALGAFLGAAILTGQLMAVLLANAGGAWDNAKKYVEDGHHGGKGSDQHKAAVIGDTVGDPFKDTAGPGLNPLIKVINLVALLLLPLVIRLEDDTAVRWVIASVAAAILAAAIAFSKRRPGRQITPPWRTRRATEQPRVGDGGTG
jgi:K(+)-stimulated pyrophosphate-energized sodium pump